jgi:hypothetical protein
MSSPNCLQLCVSWGLGNLVFCFLQMSEGVIVVVLSRAQGTHADKIELQHFRRHIAATLISLVQKGNDDVLFYIIWSPYQEQYTTVFVNTCLRICYVTARYTSHTSLFSALVFGFRLLLPLSPDRSSRPHFQLKHLSASLQNARL